MLLSLLEKTYYYCHRVSLIFPLIVVSYYREGNITLTLFIDLVYNWSEEAHGSIYSTVSKWKTILTLNNCQNPQTSKTQHNLNLGWVWNNYCCSQPHPKIFWPKYFTKNFVSMKKINCVYTCTCYFTCASSFAHRHVFLNKLDAIPQCFPCRDTSGLGQSVPPKT